MSDHHEIFTPFFFFDPEVIFSSHTMFINAPTKEFTLTHLVTFILAMACDSVIYKSKLLSGSINKHGMRTKKYLMV